MMKKKLMSILLALSMVMGLSVPAFAVESYIKDSSFTSAYLMQNLDLMTQVFNGQEQTFSNKLNFTQIEISGDKKSIYVYMQYDNFAYASTLTGSVEEILSGYVGVYEGRLTSVEGDDMTLPVIADVTFTKDEMFAALTIGDCMNGNIPKTLFFGAISETIAEIATTYSLQTNNADLSEDVIYDEEIEPYATTLDTSWYLLDKIDIIAGSYKVGSACFSGQKEFLNGMTTDIMTKVNADKGNFEKYLVNDAGYLPATLVKNSMYLDQVTTSISTDRTNFYIDKFSPESDEKSFTLKVPVAIPEELTVGAILGIPSIDLKVTTSSITTKTDTTIRPTQVDWTLYKRDGWTDSEVKGSTSSYTGIPVFATLKYSGKVNSKLSVGLSSATTLRFAYRINTGSSIVTLHQSFSPARTLIAAITVYPTIVE